MSALRGLFTTLISYIWRAEPEPRHALVRGASNTLNGLPAELILSISTFLKPIDLLCFSLCSRWISTVLDGQRRKLRYAPERFQLLLRLDRDLPDQFVCHECYLLHKYNESRDFRLPHPFDFRPQYQCITRDKHHKLLLHQTDSGHVTYEFYFIHLQLAMKRFYYGPVAGISTDSLFTVEVAQSIRTTTLFCCEARICCQPPALHLRVQDILLFHNNDEMKWWEEPTVRNLLICHHQSHGKLFALMIDLSVKFFRAKKDVEFSNLCDKCNTEYQVELRAFNGKLAVIITRWIDLGRGIKPIDSRWTVHAQWIPKNYCTSLEPNDMSHSPRAAFEDACGERNSLDYLRSRNLAYLKDRNYEKIMKQRLFSGSRWFLWQKDVR